MSAYSELIKNFEKIRAYMRDFYVYGFKSREEYQRKSARSYDDERRRIESMLGQYMGFTRTPEGKNVFISIDSRSTSHNPLYKAWKSKSFTDKDITLHFIIFDILHEPSVKLTLCRIIELIESKYLSVFDEPMEFDESTVRKKLKEYSAMGIIILEKQGKQTFYSCAPYISLDGMEDAIGFYSEVAPCGVIGSYILDKLQVQNHPFTFKHHYITGAVDSGVAATLFMAMQDKCTVSAENLSRRRREAKTIRLVPLRILISSQNGRVHLIAYMPEQKCINSLRVDYLSNVKIEEPAPDFDRLRLTLDDMEKKMWGVMCNYFNGNPGKTQHVEFTVKIGRGENYIINRLEREKRCGRVEKIDDDTYRFSADVYDTHEMFPWIRTFICRIESISFSSRTQENRFKSELEEMYEMYGITGGGGSDIQ